MNNYFFLDKGELNKPYFIVGISAEIDIKRYLVALGFVKTHIQIIKKSIFKKCYLVKIRGEIIAIREKIATKIMVKNG